jgi:sugar lactone lactonase YvrE
MHNLPAKVNVSVTVSVDGAQVGSTHCVSLDSGSSDTKRFLWIARAAKGYSVEGEDGVVSPEGIAVDTSGNVYVTDSGNAQIQKFDSYGKFG